MVRLTVILSSGAYLCLSTRCIYTHREEWKAEDHTQMHMLFEQLSNQNATMRGGSRLKTTIISNTQKYL